MGLRRDELRRLRHPTAAFLAAQSGRKTVNRDDISIEMTADPRRLSFSVGVVGTLFPDGQIPNKELLFAMARLALEDHEVRIVSSHLQPFMQKDLEQKCRQALLEAGFNGDQMDRLDALDFFTVSDKSALGRAAGGQRFDVIISDNACVNWCEHGVHMQSNSPQALVFFEIVNESALSDTSGATGLNVEAVINGLYGQGCLDYEAGADSTYDHDDI